MSAGFSVAHASNDERVQALQIGAAVLRSRWPNVQADCIVSCGPNMLNAHAAMGWPGVVRVTMSFSGKLLAQSLPGHPFALDHSATA